MTTELVELADRAEFTVDEALRIADQNADSYEKVASVSRTLAAEVRRLRALASRAGGWISVKDRLPNEDDPVWCFIPGGDPYIGAYVYVENEGCVWTHCENSHYMEDGKWKCYDAMWDDQYDVTHWQPLPEPPAAPEPVAVGSNNLSNDEEESP